MKTFIFTTILLTTNLASAILVIPSHCRFSRQDTAAPARSSNLLSALMQTTRDAAGRSAMKFLERGYHRRTDLERRMIERNPSYALPYANSNLFAPLLPGMMCNIEWDDFDVAGGLNHFLISAILTA